MSGPYPRVSLVAWEDRQNRFIFVAVPNERGRYLRTDRSVALVECPVCGSMQGEPCKTIDEGVYVGATHYGRRNRCKEKYGRRAAADDVMGKLP